MRFHNIVEELFGTKEKIRVLRVITKHPKEYTSSELAHYSDVSTAGVINIMYGFEKNGIVQSRKLGRSLLWKLNTHHRLYSIVRTLFSQEDNLVIYDLGNLIRTTIKGKKLVRKAVLYGSVVTGSERADSDIDLLLIVSKKDQQLDGLQNKLREKVLRNYGNMLSILVFTEERWKKASKKLRKGIEEGGIVIWPI